MRIATTVNEATRASYTDDMARRKRRSVERCVLKRDVLLSFSVHTSKHVH